jgi:hypothetical protein
MLPWKVLKSRGRSDIMFSFFTNLKYDYVSQSPGWRIVFVDTSVQNLPDFGGSILVQAFRPI